MARNQPSLIFSGPQGNPHWSSNVGSATDELYILMTKLIVFIQRSWGHNAELMAIDNFGLFAPQLPIQLGKWFEGCGSMKFLMARSQNHNAEILSSMDTPIWVLGNRVK